MKPGLDGADRKLKRLGDLGVRKIREVLQRQHRPLLPGEALEPALQLIVEGLDVRHTPGRSVLECLEIEQHEVRATSALAVSLRVSPAHEDAICPRLKGAGVAKARQLTPHFDQCHLGGVFGSRGVAEDVDRGRVQPVADLCHERLESHLIASLRLLHHGSIHRSSGGLVMGPSTTERARTRRWFKKSSRGGASPSRDELAPPPPAEGPILRARPFMTAKLDEDRIQSLLRFALGVGGLGDACERYETHEIDGTGSDVFTIRAGGLDKRVEVSVSGPFGALEHYLRNFDRSGIKATLWVPDRFWGNLLDASIFKNIGNGVTPGLADTGAAPWPWSGVAPVEFVRLADVSQGRRIMSAKQPCRLIGTGWRLIVPAEPLWRRQWSRFDRSRPPRISARLPDPSLET